MKIMTALLQLINISFSHGSQPIFVDLNLQINTGDKLGLIGHNGCGKSTLLSLINKHWPLDKGEIRRPGGTQIAIVEQFVPTPLLNLSLLASICSVFAEDEREQNVWRAQSQLLVLGFNDQQFAIPVHALSGGQQNLLLIARALVLNPDLLLLDEPGNHMDIVAMTQLQKFLKHDCRCAFMIISHDQYLLNNVCSQSIFLRDKSCQKFNLPYNLARQELLKQDDSDKKRLGDEEREISRLTATAKRLAIQGREHDNQKLSRKAKSIEKRVVKLAGNKTTLTQVSQLKLTLDDLQLHAKQLLLINNACIKTPDDNLKLLDIAELLVKPGDRIALLGINGAGKSSTLNAIQNAYLKQLEEDTNTDRAIRFHPRTALGYYDQELHSLTQNISRIDWLRDNVTKNTTEDQIKSALIKAGIAYHDFNRSVNSLSGGEKSRMMFLLFSLTQPNFLILDEPTNHIDLQGKQQLNEQLMASGATLLITSHDRDFLQQVANRWLWIKDRQLIEVNSADSFYLHITETTVSLKPPTTNIGLAAESFPAEHASEYELLSRIEVLEKKLHRDLQQSAKKQKPHKQSAWQQEIKILWSRLS